VPEFYGDGLSFLGERLAHPRRGGKPEIKQERYPPLDEAACSAILFWGMSFTNPLSFFVLIFGDLVCKGVKGGFTGLTKSSDLTFF
jgi:hypothetical protein